MSRNWKAQRNWSRDAAYRATRRKNPWNLVLLLAAFGVLGVYWYLTVFLAVQVGIYVSGAPNQLKEWPEFLATVMCVLSFLASVIPAMLTTNAVFFQIGPAKRVFEREAAEFEARTPPYPDYESQFSLNYAGSQASLKKFIPASLIVWLMSICTAFFA